MRFRPAAALALVAGAALAAPAGAAVPHTVQPGETLWSIAYANGFTTRSLAAYNGLSEGSNVVLGSTIEIPSVPEAAGALAAQGTLAPSTPASGTTTTSTPAVSASTPGPMGGYTVQPGDTLWTLARRSGIPEAQMAAMNGLPADARIVAGTALKLPTGSPVSPSSTGTVTPATTTTTTPTPAAPAAAPQPTSTRLSSSEVGSVAASSGVSPSLASAVAYQESGFNNAAVSSAGARGVMQVMPGTWNWVEQNLSGPLDPASATDNVRAGTSYLNYLLRQTGGDVSKAVAGYYQGLGSVEHHGLLPSTRRYVADVLALQSRFGG